MAMNYPPQRSRSIPLQKATPGVQELVNKVRTQVEERLVMKFDVYEAVLYSGQVVPREGTNVSVKVYVGGDRYIHLGLSEDLDGTVNLTSVTDNRNKDDPM